MWLPVDHETKKQIEYLIPLQEVFKELEKELQKKSGFKEIAYLNTCITNAGLSVYATLSVKLKEDFITSLADIGRKHCLVYQQIEIIDIDSNVCFLVVLNRDKNLLFAKYFVYVSMIVFICLIFYLLLKISM